MAPRMPALTVKVNAAVATQIQLLRTQPGVAAYYTKKTGDGILSSIIFGSEIFMQPCSVQ